VKVNIKNNFSRNKSTREVSSELLKALKKAYFGEAGVISYIFIEPRLKFSKKYPHGERVYNKSKTVCPINPQVFVGENKGKEFKRSPSEVLNIFHGIKEDLGASYFEIS